jgi:hypothetical protein
MITIILFLILFSPNQSSSTTAAATRLGESFQLKSDKCAGRLIFSVKDITNKGIWNYYTLTLELENTSSDLLTIDWSKIYLTDNEGLQLFSVKDDHDMVMAHSAKAINDSNELIARVSELTGRPITAELIRNRQAIEKQSKPYDEKPIELPPGARQSISREYHTPLSIQFVTLSLIGIRIANSAVLTQPVKIIVTDQK